MITALPASREERIARYRDYAAFLRQLAGQTKIDTARAQLRNLADQFDRLAASIRRTALAG